MISSLRGKINRLWGNNCELEVNNVGYEIKLKVDSLKSKVGQEIKIPIQMIVSENDVSLYGFDDDEGKTIFNLLRSVGGVGPKSAAGIV